MTQPNTQQGEKREVIGCGHELPVVHDMSIKEDYFVTYFSCRKCSLITAIPRRILRSISELFEAESRKNEQERYNYLMKNKDTL